MTNKPTTPDPAPRPTFDEVVTQMREGRDWDNAPTTDEILRIIREYRDR